MEFLKTVRNSTLIQSGNKSNSAAEFGGCSGQLESRTVFQYCCRLELDTGTVFLGRYLCLNSLLSSNTITDALGQT
jgi:hypothetical protein